MKRVPAVGVVTPCDAEGGAKVSEEEGGITISITIDT